MAPAGTRGLAIAVAAVALPLFLPGAYHRHVLVLAGVVGFLTLCLVLPGVLLVVRGLNGLLARRQ